MTQPTPPPPLPAWADPSATWEQLIAQMRFWLKPGDEMFSDEDLMYLLSAAPSMGAAVILGWRTKIRMYSDPNRLQSAQIGNESMTWVDIPTFTRRAEGIIEDLKRQFGISSGGSRIMALDEYPQVYGVTPYRASPPPVVLTPTWPFGGHNTDISRFGPDDDAPRPTPYRGPTEVNPALTSPPPEPLEPPKPRPTVRPRRT